MASTASQETLGTATAARATDDRVERAFNSARRNSGRVRVLKFALPALAILMVVGFVAKSWVATPEGFTANLAGTAIENGRLVMASPKLDGFTGDNRPYSMSATRAIQDIGNASRIDLEGIDAKLPFDESNWMTFTAQSGVYDRDANSLNIDSDIKVVTDSGVTALLKSASVDIGKGSLNTSDPVDITLDGARIEADSMSVKDKGAVMVFEKRVRMNIDGKRLQTARAEGTTNEN